MVAERTPLSPAVRIQPISGPPMLRRINGVGTTIGGALRDPSIAPWFYKQLVVTVIFVPVLFGHIYVVREAKGQGWHFGGRVSGAEFARAYGWAGYVRFKLTVLAEVLILGTLLLAVIATVALGMSWFRARF
jgi:hypothetical protein